MSTFRLTKLGAARRQIDAAIEMTFSRQDAAAVHSVAAAAYGIVKDLCEHQKDVESYLRFTDWIVPEHEKVFWKAVNKSANFLKHADRDPEAVHELDEEETDFTILFASKWYSDLTGERSAAMLAFIVWFTIRHPKMMGKAARLSFQDSGSLGTMEQLITHSSTLTREDLCLLGLVLLKQHKANASRPPAVDRVT